MKSIYFFVILSLITTLGAFAQKGIPFIANYELPSTMNNKNWSIIQSEEDQLMYVLNRKGVYVFDGFDWTKLSLKGKPTAIFSLNNLFISTNLEIGYFKKDKTGDFQYTSVQDSTFDIFYKFLKINQDLYACGTQHICKISMGDTPKTEPVFIETDSTKIITDFFELNGFIYIIKNKNSVYRLDKNNAAPIKINLKKGENISFTFNHNHDTYIGTSSNRLFLFNGREFKAIWLKEYKYLNASYMNGGLSLDSSRFAISTLIGGCSIVNSKTLESEYVFNYITGLPDDEIFSLGKDKLQGLWIAHGMGISRVDLNIPVKSYQHYSGISGNIISIAEYNKTIYAGGSDGLYYLSEVKSYSSFEVPTVLPTQTKAIEEIKNTNETQVIQSETQDEEKDSKKKRLKGFFSNLFNKSDKSETQTIGLFSSEGRLSRKKNTEISAAKKKIYALQSVTNIYKKVKGVDGKCKQLLVHNHNLIAATSTGLWEVSNNKGKSILSDCYILFVKPSEFNTNNLYVCSTEGISLLTKVGNKWMENKLFSFENEYPYSIAELDDKTLLVATEFNVFKLTLVQGGEAISKCLTSADIIVETPVVRKVLGKIKVFTSTGIYVYNQSKDILEDEGIINSNYAINTIYSQDDYSWVNVGRTWNLYSSEKEISLDVTSYLGLFDNINYIFINDKNELLVLNEFSQIIKIIKSNNELIKQGFPLFLRKVVDKEGIKLDQRSIRLNYSNNALRIRLGAPFFVKEKSLEIQYLIEGLTNTWTEWSTNPVIDLPYFPNGKYIIKIKARDVLGHESEICTLPFSVKPPFWKTFWFISICVILIIFLFIQIIKFRERHLQKENQILEKKVVERTKTIEKQKLDITQSIEYAKRIQNAVMLTKDEINAILPEHFILFKPRDIVSGDFYWMAKKNNKIIVAAADCTGHGVPGAFMSMLGISFLNEIVIGGNETNPDQILNQLRSLIKKTLSQTGKEGESKDGMDISLCTIDLEKKSLQHAGAYNSLYLIRNGDLTEFKGDKMPIGIHIQEKSFKNNEMNFQSGDCIYLFSDGYVSQFGGDKGRTYKSKPFKNLLATIADKTMENQSEMLNQEFEEWRGINPQVDDVLVIGVRFV